MYLSKFDKSYQSKEEYEMRREIFNENLKIIKEHNSNQTGYVLKPGWMADWTQDEVSKMRGYRH
jgi:Cathepsin propeptide inhibitor domain (I29)